MAARKSTGKRQRFEIFKRDSFACQYCGAQPPDVVLVVDHVIAVASGGTNDQENLITACEPCNQGKADKPLGNVIVRPDADLMYLAVQQEKAELARYMLAVNERDKGRRPFLRLVQREWQSLAPEFDGYPNDKTVTELLEKYGPEITREAMRGTAKKLDSGYLAERQWLRYLRGTARTMNVEREAAPLVEEIRSQWTARSLCKWCPTSRAIMGVIAKYGSDVAETTFGMLAESLVLGRITEDNWETPRDAWALELSQMPPARFQSRLDRVRWQAERVREMAS
jgi:hypothetical protein